MKNAKSIKLSQQGAPPVEPASHSVNVTSPSKTDTRQAHEGIMRPSLAGSRPTRHDGAVGSVGKKGSITKLGGGGRGDGFKFSY